MFTKDKTLLSVANAARGVMQQKVQEQEIKEKKSLVEMADKTLNDVFGVYMKAHSYYLNSQQKETFRTVYESVLAEINPLAEQIQMLGGSVMLSPTNLVRKSSIVEDVSFVTNSSYMNSKLNEELTKVVREMKVLRAAADKLNETAFAAHLNLLIDRFSRLNEKVVK